MPQRCFYVSGRVQGVWFRESTRRKALELGLSGSATNLEDGRVRVLAQGAEEGLSDLEAWLQRGPPMATVSEVQSEATTFNPIKGFVTA